MKAPSPSVNVPSPGSSAEQAPFPVVNEKSATTGSTYKFRLYVADDSQNSAAARANLAALCKQYLQDRHEIEIVDVFREPARALDDHITLTPTLIKYAPLPMCRIVGRLSDTQTLVTVLRLRVGTE
jgi:circadian clock protein KaiB